MDSVSLNNRVAPQCGQCAHWLRKPGDPNNLGQVSGDCRAMPPQIMFAQVDQPIAPGKVNINVNVIGATYPILPPNFPACAMFASTHQLQHPEAEE